VEGWGHSSSCKALSKLEALGLILSISKTKQHKTKNNKKKLVDGKQHARGAFM
jgi:hypothetical protein